MKSFKIYEGSRENEFWYDTFIFNEIEIKDIKQKNGIAYIKYFDGNKMTELYFDNGKSIIKDSYILCKNRKAIDNYFGTGLDLIIYTLKNGKKLFCRKNRWQGNIPFETLILYGNNEGELIENLEKEF